MQLRIDKYLADMGTGTRSMIKEYIRKGRVSVNGTVIKDSSIKVDCDKDRVTFDRNDVSYVQYEYYMLNKPAGVLSATGDANARTVIDLIDSRRKDLFPVGRLDKDTEGLLLITNDGELAHRLLSPRRHVDKTYYVETDGRLTKEHAELMASGFKVDDELTALPATLLITESSDTHSEALITIHEGKFHQIKRMMAAVGCEVTYLKRLSMGSLVLPEMMLPGEYRMLTKQELDEIKEI